MTREEISAVSQMMRTREGRVRTDLLSTDTRVANNLKGASSSALPSGLAGLGEDA